MPTLNGLVRDEAELLALDTSELGALLLEYMVTTPQQHGRLTHGPSLAGHIVGELQAQHRSPEIFSAISEAFQWLLTEGLICPAIDQHQAYGWFIVTRKGHSAADRAGVKSMISAAQLPAQFLHPAIELRCRGYFLRGDFETAVIMAFRELEIAIRNAMDAEDRLVGIDLAREAFRPKSGLLSNTSALPAEQESLAHLMAGAIGSYRNPTSHRRIALTAEETRDQLILASHLMKIIDARRAQMSATVLRGAGGDLQ